MLAVPAETPVTVPPPLIVAIAKLPLAHVPPPGVLPSVVWAPSHTASVPVMAVGIGFTVATTVSKQPLGAVYVMVAVPAKTPVTTPVAPSTVATPALLLVQLPPGVAFAKAVVAPTHNEAVPVIAAGDAMTVTTPGVEQPAPEV